MWVATTLKRAMSSGVWWSAYNSASSAMPWTVASSASMRAASSSPPQIRGVPEGRVYGRRLAFVSVRTIKRHHHHHLGLDTATAVEGYMPVTRPGAPSVHHLQHVVVINTPTTPQRRKTRVMMLPSCPLKYHDVSLSPVRLTWCCTKHAPLYQPQCIFIQPTDTDVTLLPNYNNMDLACSHVMIHTSPPVISFCF